MNLTSALLKNVIIESSNLNETIINETEPQDVPFEEDEEFIPVSMNNIKSELMAMREKIVSAYTYAYNDTLEEEVKKM